MCISLVGYQGMKPLSVIRVLILSYCVIIGAPRSQHSQEGTERKNRPAVAVEDARVQSLSQNLPFRFMGNGGGDYSSAAGTRRARRFNAHCCSTLGEGRRCNELPMCYYCITTITTPHLYTATFHLKSFIVTCRARCWPDAWL